MSERKTIITNIGSPLEIDTDYDYDDKPLDIEELKTFIEEAIKKGANKIKFSGTTEYDSSCTLETVSIQPVLVEEESDKNYNYRLQQDAILKKNEQYRRKENRRELYEELKEEFKD